MENDYKVLWFALKSLLNQLEKNNYLYFNSLDKNCFINEVNEINNNKQIQENDYLNMQRGYYYNSSKDILKEMDNLEKNLCIKEELEKDRIQDMKNRSHKLKGWDWEELEDAFDLKQPNIPYDKDPFNDLKAQRIKEYVYSLNGGERKQAIKIMREFLEKAILHAEKNNINISLLPIWKDMIKLEEDEDFCYVFLSLIQTIWT